MPSRNYARGEDQDKFSKRYEDWLQRSEKAHNKADVIIAKQRNGPIGPVQVQFDPQFGRFRNLEIADY